MARRARPVVGAPLDDLLGGAIDTLVNAPTTTREVRLEELVTLPGQPRRTFDEGGLRELATSLRAQGVLTPLLVRPGANGTYEIVAGERRWRAARLADLATVPIVVRDLDDETARTVALVENLQREDLNPVDRADAIARLVASALQVSVDRVPAALSALRKDPEAEEHAEQIARLDGVFALVGGSWQAFLTHLLPVLRFPEDVLAAVRAGQLEYTKGALLARIKDADERARLLGLALDGASLDDLRRATHPTQEGKDAERDQVRRVTRALANRKTMDALSNRHRAKVHRLLAELEHLLGVENR